MNLQFQSSLSPDIVLSYLTTPDKFVHVHPIIYRMQPLSENTYKVYEKVKFGFITYRFTYTAQIAQDRAMGVVTIRAMIKRMTHITMLFKIFESESGTSIEETIEIKSPLPIKNYLMQLLKEQHTLMFENLENVAATRGVTGS